MDTQEISSERPSPAALAKVTDSAVRRSAGGLGFTPRGAATSAEQVVVVEIETPRAVDARRTVPHGPAYLADQRLRVADIRVAMAEATPAAYDLVLLDVDNGPGFLVHDDNVALYQRTFLEQTRACLSPGGALVIWSAAESPTLQKEMREAFGNAVAVPFEVTLQSRDEQYWIYLSRVEA
jgi:spermidine synthase